MEEYTRLAKPDVTTRNPIGKVMYFIQQDHMVRIEMIFVTYSFSRIFFDEISHIVITRKNTWLEAGCSLCLAFLFLIFAIISLGAGAAFWYIPFLIFLIPVIILGTYGIILSIRGELLVQVCSDDYKIELRLRNSGVKRRHFVNNLLRAIDRYQRRHQPGIEKDEDPLGLF